MNRSPTTNIVFLCVEGLLLLAIVASLLRSLLSCDLPSRIRSILERAVAAIKYHSKEDDDEVGRIVTAKMQKLMLDNFRSACHALCWLLSAGSFWMMVQIVKDTAVRESFITDILQMFLQGVLTLVVVCPSSLNMRTVDWVYGALILSGAAYASPLIQKEPGLWFMVANLPVVLLSAARRRVGIVIPMNLLYGVATTWSILSEGWSNLESNLSTQTFVIMSQFVFIFTFPVCAHFLEAGMASIIRKSMKAEAANELLSAASALLRSCCDVQVEVSAEGVIVCPALDLKSLLMRPPSCSLQNTNFSDLMPHEDDKRLFARSLQTARTSDMGLAEAIHVSIRGASGKHVKVEIMSFKFHHFDGQPRFMIGLREFSDMPAASKRRRRRQRAAPRGETDTTVVVEEGTEPSVASSDGDESSFHSTLGSVSYGTGHVDIAPAVVLVDSTRPRLPVHGTSSGFRMRVGRLAPGSCMLDLVQQGDEFVSWLQRAQQAAAYGTEFPDTRVTLNIKRGRLNATCRVLRDTEEEMLDWEHTQLLFCDLQNCGALSEGCAVSRPILPEDFQHTPVVHTSL